MDCETCKDTGRVAMIEGENPDSPDCAGYYRYCDDCERIDVDADEREYKTIRSAMYNAHAVSWAVKQSGNQS